MPVPFEEEMAVYAPEPVEPQIALADLERPMFKHALASVREELLAMDASRLVAVNVDIPWAITIVLGATPELKRLRPAMAEWFGEDMAARVDRLELLARALGQAHGRYRRDESGVDLAAIGAHARELRIALNAELQALAARKVIRLSDVGELKGGTGFRLIGFDLVRICSFFYDEWDRIGPMTRYTMDEIERVEGVANQLITGVGVREQAGQSPSALLRQRAFSLLWETYDEVRSMLSFLRWKQGDADRIAPSWHAGAKGRKQSEEPTEPVLAEPPFEDVPRPGLPGAPPFVDEVEP